MADHKSTKQRFCPCGTAFRPWRPTQQWCSIKCANAMKTPHVHSRIPVEQRFWPKVDKSGDCWIWTGARSASGYGVSCRDGVKHVRAHRIAYELTHGPIPVGLYVLHRCDNPPCVNPAHLFLGTSKDNTADMIAKGRASFQRGVDRG